MSGANSSFPQDLTSVNGILYFTADDGVHKRELWKSDGKKSGTVLVKDINSQTYFGYPLSSYPYGLTDVNGTLYFSADDGISGEELWRSNGTAGGTALVKDIRPGGGYFGSSRPSNFTNVNGTLFFTANDGTTGVELWKSNGSDSGTVLVKDIAPGGAFDNSFPSQLTNVNGTLYFNASDGLTGFELWKSDGTAAGTVLVADILPGVFSSYPGSLTNVNGTLFFSAFDPIHGRELWKLDPLL